MKKAKMLVIILLLIAAVFLLILAYFFAGRAPSQKNITWGVDFSQMHTEAMGLNWKDAYLAIIKDLGVKNIKLHTQWDFVGGKRNDYFFDDIDWQIKKAEENGVKIIYVVGMKTGRWPECHLPQWAESLEKKEQQDELLKYISQIVNRYKSSKAIYAWQVENEPLFQFGECPWYDVDFLKKEVEFVRSLDPSRQIVLSDTGEYSLWLGAAKIGDIIGTTMYRNTYFHLYDGKGIFMNYYFPPVFYWRKAQIIKKIFGKDVICVELQAEPWASKPFYNVSLKEQEKTMNLEKFKKNIEYAKKTGLSEFYLWGVEWWYWLKTKHNTPDIWNEAKELF